MVAVVALVTAPSADADRVAQAILERRLAACVNVVPSLRSRYWWKGALHDAEEALLLVKTVRERIAALDALLREVHPYETFELVALEVTDGSAAYLDWIAREASG